MANANTPIDPQYTNPEHLGDPYLGAWLVHDAFDEATANAVIEEVWSSGQVEPIWDIPEGSVNQIFRRLLIDVTRPHTFPKVEALGRALGERVVKQIVHLFPNAAGFRVDEAAVQIYPPEIELALGWHKDHKLDELLVVSAVLAGSGKVGFTAKTPFKDVQPEEIIAEVQTGPLDALVFRANGLYEREDGSDIRVAHAVTAIDPGEDRFTIQYRMGVNAGAYGNTHVNH